MNLTADQFAEVLHTLKAPVENATTDEKRRAARVLHCARVPITEGADARHGPTTTVMVKDLSPRGICIGHDAQMEIGANFILRLSREDSTEIHLLCTVAWCREESMSMYMIGAEFICQLDTQ